MIFICPKIMMVSVLTAHSLQSHLARNKKKECDVAPTRTSSVKTDRETVAVISLIFC